MMMENNYDKIIYKASNEKTNQVYIGVTSNSLKSRIKDHFQKAHKGASQKFHQAIATYGSEAFIWEQIDTANTPNELAEKERQFVLVYNSKNSGYNSDRGGGIKKTVYQYEVEFGNLVYSYPDLESAGNAVSADKKSISKACLGESKISAGYHWSYSLNDNFKPEADKRLKKVFQFNRIGKFISSFNSVAEASMKTGLNKSSIAKCCRGEYKHSGTFLWKY